MVDSVYCMCAVGGGFVVACFFMVGWIWIWWRRAPPKNTTAHTSRRNTPQEEVWAIRQALLAWYRAHRRKLPWRGDPPPYGTVVGYVNT